VAGQLTAAFAHEVGTPLNLVNSHLQLLQGQSDVGEKSRERLAVIHAQIERVGDIVRKMMDLTRRPGIQQEPVPLGPLVADLQRLWSPTLAIHNISFGWDAPDPCVLYVDRKQMEQLFINMVNNSVDAMPEGGHLQLSAEREPATARWLVRVSDTGTGIAPELLQKVFRPMFTTKPEGQGTGLGLAICREIVRAHGGEIHIESEEGQGTTMSFSLPGLPGLT
jgi:signal transduction histidine kinase